MFRVNCVVDHFIEMSPLHSIYKSTEQRKSSEQCKITNNAKVSNNTKVPKMQNHITIKKKGPNDKIVPNNAKVLMCLLLCDRGIRRPQHSHW